MNSEWITEATMATKIKHVRIHGKHVLLMWWYGDGRDMPSEWTLPKNHRRILSMIRGLRWRNPDARKRVRPL